MALLNDLTGELPILEIPIYIKDRTTHRMIRTNRIEDRGQFYIFLPPVCRIS